MHAASRLLFLAVVLGLAPFGGAQTPAPAAPPASAPEPATAEVRGRLEQHDGLRVLRVWGSPAERGYAHGFLLAQDIADVLRTEFEQRFARRKPLLDQARAAVARLIEYPDDVAAELDALWQGIVDAGVDRRMPELERAFDSTDLRVANALDVFGLMGCSSFTVWGEQVVGGGVLTARNFDWPFTGERVLDSTLLIVQHLPEDHATCAVAWPGYVGAVTGVSSDGVATFLHVGSAKVSLTPEPSSWPSAIAARAILERGASGEAKDVFAAAQSLLEYTSPPAGFLTHVVLPSATADAAPVAVFEASTKDVVIGGAAGGPLVLTNHFLTRADGRTASKDSLDRKRRIEGGISGCFEAGDRVVDIAEAWQVLESVQRGGGHAFGTLHSLVFRHEPWHFELRLAEHQEKGLVAAPVGARRFVLSREQVFGSGDPSRR